jgi:hypothetical protein
MTTRSITRPNPGDTIVELLLYAALLCIFLLALFNLFSLIISNQTRATAVSLVQSNGNFLLAKLAYDLNQADAITSPLTIGSSAVSMTLVNVGVTTVYSVTNGRLNLSVGTSVNALNDADTAVSNFIVRRLGNVGGSNSLQVGFTVTSLVVDNTSLKAADFSTTAAIR